MRRRAGPLNETLVQSRNGRKNEIVMAPRKAAKLGFDHGRGPECDRTKNDSAQSERSCLHRNQG